MTNAEAGFSIALRPRKPEGSLGRTAQDGHLDSHTAPELCCPCVALHRYDQCVRTDRAGNSISLEPVSVLNRSGDGDPTGGSSAREGILGLGDKVEGMYFLRNTEKYDATGGEIPPYTYGEASLSPPVSSLCNVIIVRRTEEAFFFQVE